MKPELWSRRDAERVVVDRSGAAEPDGIHMVHPNCREVAIGSERSGAAGGVYGEDLISGGELAGRRAVRIHNRHEPGMAARTGFPAHGAGSSAAERRKHVSGDDQRGAGEREPEEPRFRAAGSGGAHWLVPISLPYGRGSVLYPATTTLRRGTSRAAGGYKRPSARRRSRLRESARLPVRCGEPCPDSNRPKKSLTGRRRDRHPGRPHRRSIRKTVPDDRAISGVRGKHAGRTTERSSRPVGP